VNKLTLAVMLQGLAIIVLGIALILHILGA